MTPWQVIEEALAHKRPPRSQKWLAEELGESVQTISNWKNRGVPARRFRDIANVLGLTVDQIEGLHPLPWDRPNSAAWPFSNELLNRVLILLDDERGRLEAVMRAHLGMPQGSLPIQANSKHFDTVQSPTVGHDSRTEEGIGLPEHMEVPEPNHQNGRSKKDQRQAHKGRGRSS